MRCRKHHSDVSSIVGVCASCLRERLFTLIAAQAQAQAQSQLNSSTPPTDDHHALPPPLLFPRSVSPYVARRKSDETDWADLGHRNHHRFYSTPQMDRTFRTSTDAVTTTFVTTGSFDQKKNKKTRFSLWTNLFRSRSDKFEKNYKITSRQSSSTSSPSWFSNIFTSHRNRTKNNQSSPTSLEEPVPVAERRNCKGVERGMSPARMSDSEEECEIFDRSPSMPSQKLQQSPIAAAPGSAKRGRPGHKRNASGIAFCLSPLVRASPNRNWNQKGLSPDISFSGDTRVPTKPHLRSNRSRKIADFGRVNHNR